MAVRLIERAEGRIVDVEVTEKLTKEDYERFVPRLEDLIAQFGRIRILFIMRDFHGWKAGALWEDLKFDWKHYSDIEKLAVIGDKAWEKGITVFCRPFTKAKIRFFKHDHIEQARQWVEEA